MTEEERAQRDAFATPEDALHVRKTPLPPDKAAPLWRRVESMFDQGIVALTEAAEAYATLAATAARVGDRDRARFYDMIRWAMSAAAGKLRRDRDRFCPPEEE